MVAAEHMTSPQLHLFYEERLYKIPDSAVQNVLVTASYSFFGGIRKEQSFESAAAADFDE